MAGISDYDETRLAGTLRSYKNDQDGTTVMHRIARAYSDDDIAVISAYLGSEDE